MTKKKLTVLELVLYVVALILLYIDGMYSRVSVVQTPPHTRSVTECSFIWAAIDRNWVDAPMYPFGRIVIILFVLNIIFLLLYLFWKQKFQDNKLCVLSSILSVLSYFIVSLYLDMGAHRYYIYSGKTSAAWFDFGVLFYIEAAVLFFVLVSNCYKYFSKIPYANSVKEKTVVVQSATTAEELKQYKELLDSGVITQEEFDAKKKQLLDL